MNTRFKMWMVLANILALVAISLAAVAVAGSGPQAPVSWHFRHGSIIEKSADNYLMNNSCPLRKTSYDILAPADLKKMISATDTAGVSNDPLIIDVRTKEEYDAGHIKEGTAEAIRYDNFGYMAKPYNLDKVDAALASHPGAKTIVFVCQSGHKGALITSIYGMLGYDARDLQGGYNAWTALK